MLQRTRIKQHTRNLRIISYVYLLLCALDDHPQAAYFALPWILYLLFDSYRIGFLSKKTLWHFGLILVFLFSLFYNKSESSLYHPMIGDEIVLPKDIYVSRGYIEGKFNASDSNFNLRDEQMVLLPKGEKIRILSFVRRGLLNFNPDYDIEVETTFNLQILDQLDPDKLTDKGHENSRLYFWSNNFFYALGMLSNAKVDEYSRTINPLFGLLAFLYPFALLYLLLQSFKKSMDRIQTNYRIHPLSLILYLVAYYYVLMASINDGFSGFLLGIPYSLFLLWEIWYLKKKSKIKYLHISVLLLALFLLLSDRSQSPFFYPMVGKTYTVTKDINYSYGSFYINKLKVYDRPYSHFNEQKTMFRLASGDSFRIESQVVTGHADMGITYTYKIQSKKFSDLREYISANLAKIKSELHDEYATNFNREKREFYFNEKKQFYIGDHELQTLMKSQGFAYNEHNIENLFTELSFFILVYPVILGLFFLTLTFRYKEIFYGKHNKTVEPIKNPKSDS